MAAGWGVLRGDGDHIHVRNLSDEIPVPVQIDQRAQLRQELESPRLVTSIDRFLPRKRVIRIREKQRPGTDRPSRIISQVVVMNERCDRIQAKPVYARFEPKPSFANHDVYHRAMVPIELRLAA